MLNIFSSSSDAIAQWASKSTRATKYAAHAGLAIASNMEHKLRNRVVIALRVDEVQKFSVPFQQS